MTRSVGRGDPTRSVGSRDQWAGLGAGEGVEVEVVAGSGVERAAIGEVAAVVEAVVADAVEDEGAFGGAVDEGATGKVVERDFGQVARSQVGQIGWQAVVIVLEETNGKIDLQQ